MIMLGGYWSRKFWDLSTINGEKWTKGNNSALEKKEDQHEKGKRKQNARKEGRLALLGMCHILCTNSHWETCHLFFLVFHVSLFFLSIVGWFFSTWFFTNSFLFPVMELWLTNPGHWVRVFYASGSYMYIEL